MASPIEEIKKRIDIVDLVGSYLRLSKAGANYKAVCPFHNEKTPSFYVSPSREIWHCFGCNAGGDIFRFVSMIEGIEFPEALQVLAQRAGVILKTEDPRISSERKKLLLLMQDAVKYYESELDRNDSAKKYLKERGLKDETVKNFNLGFAPDGWENLAGYLSRKGHKTEDAEKAGLLIKSLNPEKRNKYYDRFRSRVMFPVSDSAGRVVGFSGRIFGKETNEGKYINSPQTILYNKSRILYLWDRAKNSVRKENSCILVEGQMDAIMSHQAGITNVVATSGTALGREHLEQIKRLASELFLAFDADQAGEAAHKRAYELSIDAGFDVNIIEVPSGKDPAETIKTDPSLWVDAVKGSKPIVAFFLDGLRKKFPGDLHKVRMEARSAVLPYIARIGDGIIKAHWVQEASKVLELKEEPLWEELKKMPSESSAPFQKKKIIKGELIKPRRVLLEESILGILALNANFVSDSEEIKNLFSKENAIILDGIISGHFSKEIEGKVSKLALETELIYGETGDLQDEFKKLLSELEAESLKSKLEILSGEIRKIELSGESSKLGEYLNRFHDASKKLNILWQKQKQK